MTRNETQIPEMMIAVSSWPLGKVDWVAHSTMPSVTTLVDRVA
jgi:hypothetical protein